MTAGPLRPFALVPILLALAAAAPAGALPGDPRIVPLAPSRPATT